MQKFVALSQTSAEMWRVFYFSKWWPFIILDFLRACLDKLQTVFGAVYHCAKFG